MSEWIFNDKLSEHEKDLMVDCIETATNILRHHPETRLVDDMQRAALIVKIALAFYDKRGKDKK